MRAWPGQHAFAQPARTGGCSPGLAPPAPVTSPPFTLTPCLPFAHPQNRQSSCAQYLGALNSCTAPAIGIYPLPATVAAAATRRGLLQTNTTGNATATAAAAAAARPAGAGAAAAAASSSSYGSKGRQSSGRQASPSGSRYGSRWTNWWARNHKGGRNGYNRYGNNRYSNGRHNGYGSRWNNWWSNRYNSWYGNRYNGGHSGGHGYGQHRPGGNGYGSNGGGGGGGGGTPRPNPNALITWQFLP